MNAVKSIQRISKAFPDGSENPNFKVEERIYLNGKDGHEVNFSKIKVRLTVPNFVSQGSSKVFYIVPRSVQVFQLLKAIQVNLAVFNYQNVEWIRKLSVEIIEYY